ncbi:methyltransferase-domain-containing protein, partial [Baffinella frigidus]
GAHFRMLNEELYTTPSSAAVDLFEKDKSLFEAYHLGFREQTKRWPQNPVDIIIKELKKLPKSTVVADLGCGDARVAEVLPNKVHSFDLVAQNERVVACDISKAPPISHHATGLEYVYQEREE